MENDAEAILELMDLNWGGIDDTWVSAEDYEYVNWTVKCNVNDMPEDEFNVQLQRSCVHHTSAVEVDVYEKARRYCLSHPSNLHRFSILHYALLKL